jgi:hypothetical protein
VHFLKFTENAVRLVLGVVVFRLLGKLALLLPVRLVPVGVLARAKDANTQDA